MSCMGSFQGPFHYKKLLSSNKNICWVSYLCSGNFFVGFSRAVNYYFIHFIVILHCIVVLVCKIKKLMMILWYFKFTRNLVFSICPTVMLNIGDSSIRCLEKNTDEHQQIQTLIVKTDHLALKLGSKKQMP